MEDNFAQEAQKRKAQAEMNLQQKIDEAAERVQAKIALRELLNRQAFIIGTNEQHRFPDFDDPTDDIMADEVREMCDELPMESDMERDRR